MSPAPLYPVQSLGVGEGFIVAVPDDLSPEARRTWAHRRRTALYALAKRHGVKVSSRLGASGLVVVRVA